MKHTYPRITSQDDRHQAAHMIAYFRQRAREAQRAIETDEYNEDIIDRQYARIVKHHAQGALQGYLMALKQVGR